MHHKSITRQEGEALIVEVARIVRDRDQTGEELEAFVLWRKQSGEVVLRLNSHRLPDALREKLINLVRTWQKTTGLEEELLIVVLPAVA